MNNYSISLRMDPTEPESKVEPIQPESNVEQSKNTKLLTDCIKNMAKMSKELMGEFNNSTKNEDKILLLRQISKHLIILVTLMNKKEIQVNPLVISNTPVASNTHLTNSIQDMTRRCKEIMSEINDTTDDEDKRILLRILAKHLIIVATLINIK